MEQPTKASPVFSHGMQIDYLVEAYATVLERLNFPKMEEEISAYWKRVDAFKTSLKRSEGKPEYSFYDGPPFATGLPHYGHLLAGTIKDTVTRYAHMTGHHVTRRFGWDCHGLPIEFEIDKELKIKSKDQVLAFGIGNYNEECRKIVMRYAKDWESTVTRLGRWIDFENDYKTLNVSFMESVWWVFKQLHEKGLVYRGFKVMPYSTGCTTPLSNFEVGLNYQNVQDPAVTVSFPLVEDPSVLLLAWTTTPWTLPSNLALCVHPNQDYVRVFDKNEKKTFILMEARLSQLYKDASEYEVKEKFKGATLKGKKYTPLFTYFVPQYGAKAFYVVCDEYVTSDAGTGIVHQAPAFGEDDYRVCLAHGIIQKEVLPCPIDANGRFTSEVTDFVGQYVKEADKNIKKHLKGLGRLIVDSTINHEYPYCWRSDTPLIYRAVPSWFVAVEKIKDRLLVNNKATYWVPQQVQEGRFHNWLADAHDWAVSRNRYWGTPLPIWTSDDGEEIVVIGSVAELEELTGAKGVNDIHRHKIDHLTIPSKKGKGVLRRVDEVFDCWFESGSMPYAQVHYPFENKELFSKSFPADFIAEGIDQTRGWFYTLLVLSTGLFDKPPFKNLIVNGLVLAADGKKMSKSKKNYPDPMLIINAYGADALRLYLVNSPVVRAENLKFKEDGVRDVLKDVFLPWFNAYRFFTQNATLVDFKPALRESLGAANVMDKWILAAMQSLIKFVRGEMDAYRLSTVVPRLVFFINQLTNWYVRLNRKRMKADAPVADRTAALNVMFEVLLSLARLMAPLTPFFTDFMYQNLRNALPAGEREDSVHYLGIPEYKADLFEAGIEEAVGTLQEVVELGRMCRDAKKITLKLGLREAIVITKKPEVAAHLRKLESYVLAELNVVKLTVTDKEDLIQVRVEPQERVLGKKFGKAGPGFVYPLLKKLTPEQLQQLATSSVTFTDPAGKSYTVEAAEVQIVRDFKGDTENFVAKSSLECVVVLDASRDEALLAKWYARELTNRIQKARKKAGLLITDPIEAYYQVDPKSPLGAVLEQNRASVEKATRLNVLPLAKRPQYARAILQEECTIAFRDAKNNEAKVRVDVALAPLVVHIDQVAVLAKYPALSANDVAVLVTGIGLTHYPTLSALVESGKVAVTYNDKSYDLFTGKEVFRSGKELLAASKRG